ncbi:MAG TPA: DUF1330 domain-containing protein [Candidatus Acidoferrum sp.]|nr:DUF1330 domain-containing protein [Candidatus Acidoferrum sp.]
MAAYFILDYELRDASAMREYIEQVPAMVRKFGGRYVVRGGKAESVEGDWRPSRIVVVAFPSWEQANRFYDSDEYQPFKTVRLNAGLSRAILVEGV